MRPEAGTAVTAITRGASDKPSDGIHGTDVQGRGGEARGEPLPPSQRFALGDQEASPIARRLSAVTASPDIVLDGAFNLNALAGRVGAPAYRLSRYFSSRLKTTLPVWRNALRMDYVRRRMAERPDLSIPEIAHDAGYSSKAALNAQFRRAYGMMPRDYRRRLLKSGER